MNILETAMWASFLVVFFFYIGYLLVLVWFYRRRRLEKKSVPLFYPTVSVIVPVYNEERTIDKKLQNIEKLSYPDDKIEVVFVNGNSTDKTSRVIKDHIQKCEKSVKLVEQSKREGYTRGVIKGILNSTGEIVIATDAAAYHCPDAIEHLVKHFKDHEVGAATGKEVVLSNPGNLGPQLEQSYRVFYDFMREAETEMDSTPDSKGEILAVRREICDSIMAKLELSPNASFDSCVPYQAKMLGYRTIYDPQAKYYEYAPASFTDRMTQQVRRATVLLGALLLFKRMILNGKYGKFGLVILPAHFIMQCLLPWMFILGGGCLLVLTVLDPIRTILLWIIALGGIIVSRKSRLFLIAFVQSQAALAIAIARLARRRESLFIETIPSTRMTKK